MRTEAEIKDSWRGVESPVVTVVCIAYNHEEYIEEAIKGFLIQETSFPFEIIIHDDASTDSTANIINQYCKRYPSIIRPILQTVNQYSLGRRATAIALPHSRGRYIALCEGDDYWFDPKKLEKQTGFMEQNPTCSMSFHPAIVIYQDEKRKSWIRNKRKGPVFLTKDEVLSGRGAFYPTAAAMFRKDALKNVQMFLRPSVPGDHSLAVAAAMAGDVGYLDETMSVFRRNRESITQKYLQRNEREVASIRTQLIESNNNYLDWLNDYSDRRFHRSLLQAKKEYIRATVVGCGRSMTLKLVLGVFDRFRSELSPVERCFTLAKLLAYRFKYFVSGRVHSRLK